MGSETVNSFKDFVLSQIRANPNNKIKNITTPSAQNTLHSFEGVLANNKVAIIVRSQNAQMSAKTITKIIDWQESVEFKNLIIVSYGGYTDTVYDYLSHHEKSNILLYEHEENHKKLFLCWSLKNGRKYPDQREEPINPSNIKKQNAKKAKKINIGIFTSKGGVGKTTISAHLAGALTIIGYETALIDLDPQSNLKKLIGSNGISIKNAGTGVERHMNVFGAKEWSDEAHKDIKAIVYDCNPELDKNPVTFIKKFDFCIIPITLNPLGLNKHASVIERTVRQIRERNTKTKFLILINQYEPKEGKKNKILLEMLKKEVAIIQQNYEGVELIEPSKVSIRYSSQLFYWGMQMLVNDSQGELAFDETSSRSIPKDNFFHLADYVALYASLK